MLIFQSVIIHLIKSWPNTKEQSAVFLSQFVLSITAPQLQGFDVTVFTIALPSELVKVWPKRPSALIKILTVCPHTVK